MAQAPQRPPKHGAHSATSTTPKTHETRETQEFTSLPADSTQAQTYHAGAAAPTPQPSVPAANSYTRASSPHHPAPSLPHTAQALNRPTRLASSRRASARAHHAFSTNHSKFALILLVFILVLVGIGISAIIIHDQMSVSSQRSAITDGEVIKLSIPEGSNAATTAKILQDAHVIESAKDFLKEVTNADAASKLKSGSYALVAGSSAQELIARLIQGPNSFENALVVPEGLTQKQLADLLNHQYEMDKGSFLAQAKASSYAKEFPFLSSAANGSLEGFLYPKTYDFQQGTPSPDAVIKTMLNQFKKEMQGFDTESSIAALNKKYGIKLSFYDVIKIASIIEKEALTDEQRPLVASVIYNRLKDDMFIQSDATMGYVTGGEVRPDDLKQESPYNTYLNKGLPPTPICSPGTASIQAALAPADTTYYYFWITKQEEKFSTTYEEHKQAIADSER